MADKSNNYKVNLFRPKQGYMLDEVWIILLILAGWGGVTFGFQALLSFLANVRGGSFLTECIFFNLPFHYWFTGQFLPLWFIILCIIFNLYIDHLTERHSHRRERFHD